MTQLLSNLPAEVLSWPRCLFFSFLSKARCVRAKAVCPVSKHLAASKRQLLVYNVKSLALNTECQMFNLCVSIELPARLSVFKHSVHHSLMDVFDCAYSLTPQQLQHWPPRPPPQPLAPATPLD